MMWESMEENYNALKQKEAEEASIGKQKKSPTVEEEVPKVEDVVPKVKEEVLKLEVKSWDSSVEVFHHAVAATVMSSLNHYYTGSAQFLGVARIRDEGMYTELARSLSHRLRQQIKESHLHLQGGLEGLQLTAHHREVIKVEVKSYCEKLPVVKRES